MIVRPRPHWLRMPFVRRGQLITITVLDAMSAMIGATLREMRGAAQAVADGPTRFVQT